MEAVCLTQHSHGGGCGCKIDPAALHEILANVPKIVADPRLMVGIESSDDAAVYRINDQQAVIVTNDFFMPIVDDPYAFGRIASANALSDVYAMGGTPILATSIVGFPVNKLPLHAMQEIMRGGVDACQDAGIPLAGGHSIDNEEPIFGLVGVGLVDPNNVKTNSGTQPGDVLLYTKPLGIGIMTTAIKINSLSEEGTNKVIDVMSRINKPGAWLGTQECVTAITDITGFGLAGHLLEMAQGANVSIVVDTSKVPVMEEAWDLASEGVVPGGAYRNLSAYGSSITFQGNLDKDYELIFTDPQTSGGLLVSVRPESVDMIMEKTREMGFEDISIIGEAKAMNGTASVTFVTE